MLGYTRTAMITALAAFGLAGCEDPMSQIGFSLPQGDFERGRQAFVDLQCHACHTISGVELPSPPEGAEPFVELGGTVTRVRTYGELVTSIINPSHRLAEGYDEEVVSVDGESKMPVYNDIMTVQELIDIVMFLQPQYDVVVPDTAYPIYH